MKEVNPGTITGTLSWYKISPLSGYNLIRVRTRIRKEAEESVYENSWSRQILWRIIVESERLHLVAQKQTELQNGQYDEYKRVHQLYYCNPYWMSSCDQILWNALAVCEMSKTSWQTGKLRMNEDLGIHHKDHLFLLVHWWNTSQIPRDKVRIHQFGKKVLPGIFPGYALIAGEGNWERRHSGCWYWRIRKFGRIRNLSQKTECKGSPGNPKRRKTCISCGRCFSNIIRKRLQIPTTLRWEHTARRENLSGESQGDREEFQPEEKKKMTRKFKKDFWSIQGDFFCCRHVEPRNQFYVPIEESLPVPLKNIDVNRSTQKNELMTIGMSTEIEICQVRGQVSRDSHCWTKLLQKDVYGPKRDWQKSKRHHVQITHGLTLGKDLEKPLREDKTRMGDRETETPTRQKYEKSLFHWSEWRKIHRHH